MPVKSEAQRRLMQGVAKNPAFAKKVGIPQSVGREFIEASPGRKLSEGGEMKESKAMVKKEIGFMKKAGAPKSMIKHEEAEAKGMKKGGKVYAKGGMTEIAKKEVKAHEKRMHGMKKGGMCKGYASGGLTAGHKSADGIAKKGKTKGRII